MNLSSAWIELYFGDPDVAVMRINDFVEEAVKNSMECHKIDESYEYYDILQEYIPETDAIVEWAKQKQVDIFSMCKEKSRAGDTII